MLSIDCAEMQWEDKFSFNTAYATFIIHTFMPIVAVALFPDGSRGYI